MRIYTRTGDTGDTGLFGGQRVRKDDLRVEAYGTVDELNAVLGMARALEPDPEQDSFLSIVQHDLFQLGSDLATPQEKDTHKGRVTITRLEPGRVAFLETLIDCCEEELPPLTNFILPGGHPVAAMLHLARVVCRRAERRCVTLAASLAEEGLPRLNPEVIRYLNRLSDLLFVMARDANQLHDVPDVIWKSE